MARIPWGRETMAGLAGAIGSVPDGMATAVLAGANPMAGLYASFAGPAAGGLLQSTTVMVVATTSAAPARLAARIDRTPIGPQPDTSTRRPFRSPACFAACSETDRGSHSAASSGATRSPIGKARPAGITNRSRKRPCS